MDTEQDLQHLPQVIKAWKQLQDEMSTLKQQLSEKKTRRKALEEVIMRTMKKNSIGALDLKQSNGRLLYKRKKTKGGLSQKNLQEYLGEYLKSTDTAEKALAFIAEKRGVKETDTLAFEKL
jgi:hypothetical protein